MKSSNEIVGLELEEARLTSDSKQRPANAKGEYSYQTKVPAHKRSWDDGTMSRGQKRQMLS